MKNILDIINPLRQYKFKRMEEVEKNHPVLLKLKRLPIILNTIIYISDKKLVDKAFEELETLLKEIEIGELR